jgi:hypothetical protein
VDTSSMQILYVLKHDRDLTIPFFDDQSTKYWNKPL